MAEFTDEDRALLLALAELARLDAPHNRGRMFVALRALEAKLKGGETNKDREIDRLKRDIAALADNNAKLSAELAAFRVKLAVVWRK